MQSGTRSSKGMGGLAVGLALALTLGLSAVALAEEAPDKIVKGVADEVLNALRQDPDLQGGSQNKMAQLIEQTVAPHFDFERMTRLAVGRSWRQATPDQQKALVEQFERIFERINREEIDAQRQLELGDEAAPKR